MIAYITYNNKTIDFDAVFLTKNELKKHYTDKGMKLRDFCEIEKDGKYMYTIALVSLIGTIKYNGTIKF